MYAKIQVTVIHIDGLLLFQEFSMPDKLPAASSGQVEILCADVKTLQASGLQRFCQVCLSNGYLLLLRAPEGRRAVQNKY